MIAEGFCGSEPSHGDQTKINYKEEHRQNNVRKKHFAGHVGETDSGGKSSKSKDKFRDRKEDDRKESGSRQENHGGRTRDIVARSVGTRSLLTRDHGS
jgi:hypothetical protein